MFWSCPALLCYWKEIFGSLSRVTHKLIEPNATIALFGVSPPSIPFSSSESAFISFVTLLARRLILLKWKSPTPPSHTLWIREVLTYVRLEKIRCVLKGSLRKFYKTWDPFFVYVRELDFPAIPEWLTTYFSDLIVETWQFLDWPMASILLLKICFIFYSVLPFAHSTDIIVY